MLRTGATGSRLTDATWPPKYFALGSSSATTAGVKIDGEVIAVPAGQPP